MDRMTAMETLVAVVEAGSFSGAARLLKVGQPSVSKSVAQLEEQLGVRLLVRSTRGLSPTEAGKNFYEHAKRAIEQADAAEHAARGSGASLSGRLRVTAAVTFARLHIVPHLKAFLAEHPQLVVDVLLEDGNIDLLEHGVDVALRMGALRDSAMTARKIAQSRRVVVGTPRYFAAAGEPKVPADLLAHEAIVYDREGGGDAWVFRRGGAEVSVEVSGRLRVTAAEGVRAAVLADIGVAIGSEWMFAPELASGEVRQVLAEWTLAPVDLWAVFPTGRMASTKVRAFVAFVEAALRRDIA
ncbi:LysR substrate-binding domain-containing protein [Cupriavidus basilensis]|uniref:LysR family transcriptional regulator n=1 Tax=Cupriavidus basilensis TaxID=68895 RepID=UPI0039F6CA21